MLTQLKVLAENMDQLERNTNFLLRHVLNGGEDGSAQEFVNKADRIAETGASIVAAGDIGCLVQIRRHLMETGQTIRAEHPVVLLDRAYRGVSFTAGDSKGS